jgi:hypothetical protein
VKSSIKWIVALTAFCSSTCLVRAQDQRYIDSLLTIAHKATPDTNAIHAFTQLQRYYFERGLFDSTLKYALEVRIRYNLGMTYTNLNQYDSASANLTRAMALMPLVNDTVMQINCYNAFAYLSNYQSDFAPPWGT